MKHQPPGQLKPGVDADVIMMICTAGHVDHGKTALVKLLTGCNTDRLKAEQERGLTIELGFAPCFLGNNLCVGIVDVPGHEKFIKNMVAGVSGIDMTILVVAVDDGIMPQTVEHFQIMELLGVRNGIVALTKTDLVADERVKDVADDVRSFIKGTFMENAPICPVSSETLAGFGEFYDILVNTIDNLVKKRRFGIFRMPIERVFTQKGFGTVMSGIPVDGTIEVGAQVELVPGNQKGRIRGVQRFLRDASEGGYGQCLALNIPDFNRNPPVRGQVLCLPGYLKPARYFHVSVTAVHGIGKPLQNAEEIKFHTGTLEEPGKLYLLENKTLGEGETGLATVALAEPVAAAVHDRFIIRRPSPAATVAGGEILAVSYADRRPRKKGTVERLKAHLDALGGVDPASAEGIERRLEHFLSHERKGGASLSEVSKATLLPSDVVGDSLYRLVESDKIMALADDHYVHAQAYSSCLAEVESRVKKAATEKGVLNLPISEVRKGLDWPAPLWNRVQEDLVSANLVEVRGSTFVLHAAVDKLDDADRGLMTELLKVYAETGFQSPRPDELPDALHATQPKIDKLLEHLCNEGKLIRLAKNVVLSYNNFKKAQDMVVGIIKEKGVLNSADFKHEINSTRKYALAILDFLDSRNVTMRVQNDRKLNPDYEKYLL
jgi:selenocysteine-specific elongation factor